MRRCYGNGIKILWEYTEGGPCTSKKWFSKQWNPGETGKERSSSWKGCDKKKHVFHVELVQIESSIVPLETWISTLLTEVWNWTIKSPFWKLAFIPPTVYLWQQHCDCCCSVAKSCPTLDPGTAAHQSLLSFTVSQSLPKFMSIELVMISNYLILCHPLLLLPRIFPNTGIFSNKSVHRIRWPKYWCFSFSISPSNEFSGLIVGHCISFLFESLYYSLFIFFQEIWS